MEVREEFDEESRRKSTIKDQDVGRDGLHAAIEVVNEELHVLSIVIVLKEY